MSKNRYILPRADLKQFIDKYIIWDNKERIQENVGFLSAVKLSKFQQQETIAI